MLDKVYAALRASTRVRAHRANLAAEAEFREALVAEALEL
jgi:hypothetical protein